MPYNIIIGRDKEDKKRFGEKGLVYIGKGYVKMGNYTSLSNKLYLDIVRSHVILIAGKRGSGKSYTIGVIAEELSKLPKEVKENIAPLIFDTMGIFWTMKYKNDKDTEALEDWGLKAEDLSVNVWVPSGHFDKYVERKIPVDKRFALAANELDIEDWVSIFGLGMIEPVSVLIQKIISRLMIKKDFDLDDVIEEINNDKDITDDTRKSGVALFEAARSWKIFAKKGEESTKIRELVVPGKTSILDLSIYSSTSSFNVRALVIGLISRKLFNQRALARKQEEMESIYHGVTRGKGSRRKKEMPIVWLFIDEAHEFLPKDEKTPATNSLIQVLREGRQPGISIVLATQQPGVIHRDVMTQSDLVLAHRLTNKNDIEALNEIMQTYMLETVQKEMRELPDLKGSGIILDDNSERLYPIRVRPRLTWHGGEAPIALVEED
ncbi:MAG: ATP-binding protein [archaeon]